MNQVLLIQSKPSKVLWKFVFYVEKRYGGRQAVGFLWDKKKPLPTGAGSGESFS